MHFLPFIAVAVVVIVTPGVDMALVTRNALVHGRSAALATALGVVTGTFGWTLAAALGVAAVVQASAEAFTVLKLAGAVYLVWLGVQALRRRERVAGAVRAARSPFRQGVICNALNPKVAVFFTSLLPQFGSSFAELLVLGLVFNVLGLLWLVSYASVAARGRVFLQRPRVQAALDYLSGVVLVALGVRLALERR
jgi:threonine/homoserine/homoserine lactone efflux protein